MGDFESPDDHVDQPVPNSNRAADDGVRVRQCAVSRALRPKNELIRFVADPDGAIHPDLACKLPGRGIWLTADRKSVESAMKSSTFARGLRLKTTVPEALADTVARLLEKRAQDALSIANKAGCVVTGFDKVTRLIEGGKAALLVHASDGAAGGCEKLDRKMRAVGRSEGRETTIIFGDLLTRDQMSLAIGRPNVIHAGLRMGGASAKFIAEARRLDCYRNGLGESSPLQGDAVLP